MARVLYSGAVSEIIGSINGWTFQKNSSGKIIRNKPIGSKTTTIKANIQKQNPTAYISQWQNVPAASQTNWNNYASLYPKQNSWGQNKNLTGFNWFMSTNFNRNLVGEATITDPPTHTLPDACPIFTGSLSDTQILLNFSPAFNPALTQLLIYSTPPISSINTSNRGLLRFTKIEAVPPFTTIDITNEWSTAHSLVYANISTVATFKVAVGIQTVQTQSGIRSPLQIIVLEKIVLNSGIGFWIIESTFIVQ